MYHFSNPWASYLSSLSSLSSVSLLYDKVSCLISIIQCIKQKEVCGAEHKAQNGTQEIVDFRISLLLLPAKCPALHVNDLLRLLKLLKARGYILQGSSPTGSVWRDFSRKCESFSLTYLRSLCSHGVGSLHPSHLSFPIFQDLSTRPGHVTSWQSQV